LDRLILQALGEFFEHRDLPEGLVDCVHVSDEVVVVNGMLCSLGNQADGVSNQVILLLVHPQAKLEELVHIGDDGHEDVVFEDLHNGLGAKAVPHVEVAGDVDSASNVEASIHQCLLGRSTLAHLLRLRDLDLNELLKIFVHDLDDLPETQMIVLRDVLLSVQIDLEEEVQACLLHGIAELGNFEVLHDVPDGKEALAFKLCHGVAAAT